MDATSYWTWWQGALALAGLATLYWLVEHRLLGVSGGMHRLADAAFEGRNKEDVGDCGSTGSRPMVRDSAHAAFLLAMVGGAALSALLAGSFRPEDGLGQSFRGFFGEGVAAPLVLLAGGVMVGFGTRLARGCTSGHGLCGTARLNPPSIAATATFFGVGIVVSFLLAGVLA